MFLTLDIFFFFNSAISKKAMVYNYFRYLNLAGTLLSSVSKKLASEGKNEVTKDSSDVANLPNSKAFSIWRIIVEACESADWLDVFSKSFKQQLLVLLVTIGIAYLLGYISLERLLIFFNFTEET